MFYWDLVSEGLIVMLKAITNFDAGNGCRFSSFAAKYISREIKQILKYQKIVQTKMLQHSLFDSYDEQLTLEERLEDKNASLGMDDYDVHILLQKLDKKEREAVKERYLEDRKLKDIARDKKVSSEMIRLRSERGIKHLRQMVMAEKLKTEIGNG